MKNKWKRFVVYATNKVLGNIRQRKVIARNSQEAIEIAKTLLTSCPDYPALGNFETIQEKENEK